MLGKGGRANFLETDDASNNYSRGIGSGGSELLGLKLLSRLEDWVGPTGTSSRQGGGGAGGHKVRTSRSWCGPAYLGHGYVLTKGHGGREKRRLGTSPQLGGVGSELDSNFGARRVGESGRSM